ncbi:hypothetical protein FA13DRAFT_1800704 [Coprinellus micaceus]|uniref:Uncharacterized protein n=1 Tax=Coprinellus micaceus TaxID=71717 RepID=A0A4Y7SFZ0_COPMI|nr:hypothetical protein FA13DRAFT_1800704 [Coprinellus micaceus]
MSQCFVAPEVFKFSQRVTKMSVTNPERFKNRETNICVIQREVIEATPDDLVEMAKQVLTSAKSEHFHHIVSEMRHTHTSIIFNIPASAYAKTTDRAQNPDSAARFKWANSNKFSKFVPVLYPGLTKDNEVIFKSLKLALMLKATLFGKTSTQFDENGKTSSAKGPVPVGKLWGIKEVTPGAIAMIATVAVNNHSPDTEFGAKGNKTGVDYEKLNSFYQEIILKGFAKDETRERFLNLFKWWNSIIFTDRLPDALLAQIESGDESSDADEALVPANRTIGDISANIDIEGDSGPQEGSQRGGLEMLWDDDLQSMDVRWNDDLLDNRHSTPARSPFIRSSSTEPEPDPELSEVQLSGKGKGRRHSPEPNKERRDLLEQSAPATSDAGGAKGESEKKGKKKGTGRLTRELEGLNISEGTHGVVESSKEARAVRPKRSSNKG